MRSTVWWWIPALSVGLLGAAPPEKDAWTLTKVPGGGCRLDSEKASLSDGYQTTSAQVRVTPTEVRVVSESTFDESKKDLAIQVDKNEAIKADGLDGAKAVVFKGAAAATLIAEVTDRETARQRAEERERLLARIAELSPQFIFIFDYDLGRDVYINRSVPAALGYSPEQEAAMQPYPFAHLCHPDDFARAMERDQRWRDAADGTVDAVEFRLRRASGEWRWFRSLNTPFRYHPDGRIAQILGLSEDVTDRRRAEGALHRSERLASLAVLAGGLAHDFGNLLTPVLGRAELLLARLPADSPLRPHAEAIRAASEHAAELVEHLQVFSGRRPTEPRPIDLNAIAADVVHLLRPVAPRGARLELELAPALPHAVGDPSQIRQVVLNLITNALDAVAGRPGRVAVRSRAESVAAEDLAAFELAEGMAPGLAILLEVEDDGTGMDEETRSRLWEPFFTTKPRGRGLGLPSVAGILRRHGGGMTVATEPGRGSCFRCYLPAAPPDPRAAEPASGAPGR